MGHNACKRYDPAKLSISSKRAFAVSSVKSSFYMGKQKFEAQRATSRSFDGNSCKSLVFLLTETKKYVKITSEYTTVERMLKERIIMKKTIALLLAVLMK